jgi:hypothetical protein
MKFEYKTNLKPADSTYYEFKSFVPCCDKAKDLHDRHNLFLDYDAAVCIGLIPDDYFGGWLSQIEILHCPFCGVKVVTEEVERVKVTVTEVSRPSVWTDKVYTEEVVFKKETHGTV